MTGGYWNGNEIKYMGLNGTGVVNFFSLKVVGERVTVDELTITGNTIAECLQQKPSKIEGKMEMAFGGITLADCENLTIRGNHIDKNGANFTAPVCGIFIREQADVCGLRRSSTSCKKTIPIESSLLWTMAPNQ